MKVELKDFSGGITEFIFGDDITTGQEVENLEITKDKALQGRWGSRPLDPTDSKPAVLSSIPSHLVSFNNHILSFYGGQILSFKDDVWTEIKGANNSIAKVLTEATNGCQISTYEWNKHLFATDDKGSKIVKVYQDENGLFQARTAGLPEITTGPTITAQSFNGSSYIYAFHYSYEYKVGDVTHLDYGPIIQVRLANGSSMLEDINGNIQGNVITSIPVLANTTKTHYDTSNIKIEIYRTIDGGSELYHLGTVANGAASYTDTTADDELSLNNLIYTDGDIPDNLEPPVCKYIELTNNCAWYASLKDRPYRVMQSQLSDPDSVPDSYFMDFEEEITGVSSFQSNPIIFTTNQVWRIEGVIELDGEGVQRKVMVADNVGCLNNNSIVKTDRGVFFASGSQNSFYWTDGYTVKKVPGDDKSFPERYSVLALNPQYIKGSFDRINSRIYWTTKGAFKFEIYVYDLTFNSFTTWAGRVDSFRPTSILCAKDKKIYRGDESGYIFAHESSLLTDPVVEVGKIPTSWAYFPVIANFKHIAFDFGSDVNKWVTKISVAGEGRTNQNIGIKSYDDSGDSPKELVSVVHRSGLLWGDPSWVWGDEADIWGVEIRMNKTRFFKSGKIRCKRKQINLFTDTTTLSQSFADLPGTKVSVDAGSKVLTVINAGLVALSSTFAGANIYINGVSFEITEVGVDTIKVKDIKNQLQNGIFDWYIEGYPHTQRFHLGSITYTYDMLDDKGGYFQKGVTVSES